ncbi:hypothetical protein ACTZIH_25990 (plasmid) [Escherichia coli]
MALGDPVKLRLSPQKQLIYEDEAARLGKPLSTYLRERLEEDDALRERFDGLRDEVRIGLSEIRNAIEDREQTGSNQQSAGAMNTALLLEMVLLLRDLGGPDRSTRAQAEVKRQGFEKWTPTKD